jgi:hypothetical protein
MDTHELARVEFSAQIADRFAEHIPAISRMQAAIIVCGFDPVDLLRRQQDFLIAIFDQET